MEILASRLCRVRRSCPPAGMLSKPLKCRLRGQTLLARRYLCPDFTFEAAIKSGKMMIFRGSARCERS